MRPSIGTANCCPEHPPLTSPSQTSPPPLSRPPPAGVESWHDQAPGNHLRVASHPPMVIGVPQRQTTGHRGIPACVGRCKFFDQSLGTPAT
jgi:hypothetical protein